MPRIDYGRLPTEQPNARSKNIDACSVLDILGLMHQEDCKVPDAVRRVRQAIARGVGLIVGSLKTGGRLFFAGAGTSGRLAVLEAAECPPTFNTPPSLIQAFMAGGRKAVFRSQEGAEDREKEGYRLVYRAVKSKDILVGIAASGITPFVRGALRAAKARGADTILITCHPNPPGHPLADCLIAPQVGPEIIAGSTRLKAGTATKLVLNQLTVASMIRLGKVYKNWMVDLQPKSRKLKERALRLVEHLGGVSRAQAPQLFERAGKNVKLAILMAQTGLDHKHAVSRLKQAKGFLKKALDES